MNINNEILAIIPARGGSKGIPKKNTALVNGKPLISYSIKSCQESAFVTRIVVSTDSEEIAQISKSSGAEVINRPVSISGDFSPSEETLLHALQTLNENENYHPSLIVFLQCTSPLTAPEDIDGTIQALFDENADSAFSVTHFHYFLWENNPVKGTIGINHDKNNRIMRQEKEPQYLETGAVYVMNATGFLKKKHRFFGKTVMHVMPEDRVLEIDVPFDLELAEFLLQRKKQGIA